jgi:hypothetical protein
MALAVNTTRINKLEHVIITNLYTQGALEGG